MGKERTWTILIDRFTYLCNGTRHQEETQTWGFDFSPLTLSIRQKIITQTWGFDFSHLYL